MMVVATIQSSIDKMVPKTSYFKMIDIWLLYSFNIIIVIMAIHTYMDTFIKWDPGYIKAYWINYMGQVLNIGIFLLFNIVFWTVALSHYYSSDSFQDQIAERE